MAIMEHKPVISEIGEHQRQSYFMAQGLEKQNSDFCIRNIQKKILYKTSKGNGTHVAEFITKIAAYKAVEKPSYFYSAIIPKKQ